MRLPRTSLIVSIVILAALIVFVSIHLGEAEQFAILAGQIEPLWFILAALLQIGTYVCVGLIWMIILGPYGHSLKISSLSKLAIEKLSVDQLMPTFGVSGNLMVGRAIRRLGLPTHQITEALALEILSRASSYTVVGIISLVILTIFGKFSTLLFIPLIVIVALISFIPFLAWWLLRHKNWQVPKWVLRYKAISQIFDVILKISSENIFSRKIFFQAILLQISIFLLDGATLLVAINALGINTSFAFTFVALVVASIAGFITFLPGGIGGFEAACIATLVMFGIPVEAALASTLLLRGITLWLPIIPGFILVNKETRH